MIKVLKKSKMVLPEARIIAASVGLLGVINMVWALVGSSDLNIWWLDLSLLPDSVARGILWVTSAALIAFAAKPAMGKIRRAGTLCLCVFWVLAALVNAIAFFHLRVNGDLHRAIAFPFSFVVLAGGLLVLQAVMKRKAKPKNYGKLRALLACGAVLIVLPLGQIICFGMTDYRKPADVAVVFGAGVHKDGSLSDALTDRITTGVELYKTGVVKKLILSGGPGMGSITEPAAMKNWAIQNGVRPQDIICDEKGFDTRATVYNTAEICKKYKLGSVLAVSHGYHLPRIKFASQQAGLNVRTVPSPEQKPLRKKTVYLAREIIALWAYYLGLK